MRLYEYQYSFVDSVDGMGARNGFISHMQLLHDDKYDGMLYQNEEEWKKIKRKIMKRHQPKGSLERTRAHNSHSYAHSSLRKKKINKRFNFSRLLPCYWIVFESYVERIAEKEEKIELDT